MQSSKSNNKKEKNDKPPSAKIKTKLEIKEKSGKNKVYKLNQDIKHEDNKKIKLGKEKENKEKKQNTIEQIKKEKENKKDHDKNQVKSNRLPLRKCKIINIKHPKDSPYFIVYALNDGRLAIGLEEKIVIYNINTYQIDIEIPTSYVQYFFQLKDNKLFYYTRHSSSNFDDYSINTFRCNYLIDISDKNYTDKTELLPENSKYDKLEEYSNGILLGGITTSCSTSQANGTSEPRIEKLVKIKDKYQIVTSYKIRFEDFVLLKGDKFLITMNENLDFHNVNTFKLNKKVKINYMKSICVYNNNLLLIGLENKKVLIFNYKTYKKIKSIVLNYNVHAIYVAFFIGYGHMDDYIIENNGEYKHLSIWPKIYIDHITQLKDGRIVTSSPIKVWS